MGFETRIAPRAEIVSTAGIIGARPRIEGTRIPVDMIILYLQEGASCLDIFSDFPSLPVGGIEAVVDWANKQGIDVQLPDR
jgi:uncharacterized protein (DUF433 family)